MTPVSPLVGVLILVLLGLLGSRVAFEPERAPAGPRLLLATGVHFLLAGILLGPILGLLTLETIGQLEPLFALGLGWIGFLFGLQLDRTELASFPVSYLLFTLAQAAVAFVLFALVGVLAVAWAGYQGPAVVATVLATAATASVSTPGGVALISRTFGFRGRLVRLLFYAASVDAVVGIVALQVTYAVFHPASAATGDIGWMLWLAIAAAMGLTFGVIFLWLTRPKPARDELILFLLGLAVFASGTAFYMGVSPLFVAAVTGAVIANLSPSRKRVYSLLQAWEKPVYVVVLILAGALLGAGSWWAVPLAAGYVLLRGAAKYAGGRVARRWVRTNVDLPRGVGLGLLPQGGISLAMALSAALTYGAVGGAEGEPIRTAFATIVIAVAASELVGPFLTRGLLRTAGEITPRDEAAVTRNASEAG